MREVWSEDLDSNSFAHNLEPWIPELLQSLHRLRHITVQIVSSLMVFQGHTRWGTTYMYMYTHDTHICIHTHIHTRTWHYITLHCIALHYATLHYSTLHYTTPHYITLHCIALHTYIYIYKPGYHRYRHTCKTWRFWQQGVLGGRRTSVEPRTKNQDYTESLGEIGSWFLVWWRS